MEVERNRLYVGDCVEFMAQMDAESVDLTVTSPPYDNLRNYNGYAFDFEAVAVGRRRVTKAGGVVVWVVGDKIAAGRSLSSFRQGLFTTNRNVAAWGDIFSDTTIAAAMLDRLLHRSVVFTISGDSSIERGPVGKTAVVGWGVQAVRGSLPVVRFSVWLLLSARRLFRLPAC